MRGSHHDGVLQIQRMLSECAALYSLLAGWVVGWLAGRQAGRQASRQAGRQTRAFLPAGSSLCLSQLPH